MDVSQLTDWTPIALNWTPTGAYVDWCSLNGRRFTEPFFEETIGRCFADPFNLLFRHQTPIETLGELCQLQPGLPPKGFIFHTSRCGSTLISRLFATLPQNVALSEPGPLDTVLRAAEEMPGLSEATRIDYLRWIVGALGQRRHPEERNLLLKFDTWHIHDLPLLRKAFPDVPWLFVFRDPVEVLVSHQRGTGSQMIPGVLPLSLVGMTYDEIAAMPPDEYPARILGMVCQTATDFVPRYGGWALDYRQLPETIWTTLPEFFGIDCSDADRETMREAGQFHAKTPAKTFVRDDATKRQAASEETRGLAERWVGPWYRELERLSVSRG